MPPNAPSPRQRLAEGLAHFNAGRMAEAVTTFRAVLLEDPSAADAHHFLGLIALRAGRAEEAVAAISRAVEQKPSEPSFRANLAVALKATGRIEDAVAMLRETIDLAPGYTQAHVNLGNTLREAARLDEAEEAYRSALDQAPDTPAILNNLGNVCRERGRLDDAIGHYRRAIEVAPEYVEARINLASAELARGAAADAVKLLDEALAIEPGNATGHLSLGRALLHLDRHAGAEAAYRRAIALMPRLPEAHAGLADTLARRGRVEGAIAAYEAAIALRPDFAAARSGLVFMRNYSAGDGPLSVAREAHAFGAAIARPDAPRTFANDPDPERRITVGLVSGDLRSHAVATFLSAVLPRIDASRYRLVAYPTVGGGDSTTEQFKGWVDAWIEVGGLDDAAFAERIVADEVDILVDLNGHTMFNRLPAFARKPAPVQVSWLGYSGTTGVAEIDYVLGDRFVTPQDEEAQLVERPWRLPDSYLCWNPPGLDIAVGPLPALQNGHVTFGSFNNINKLSDAAVSLWAKVLVAVPQSRLLLKAGPLGEASTANEVRDRFVAHGIEAERLTLVGRVADAAAHLRTYDQVDIGLDPFPYNGTTTTAEALWMGVPVLGLAGDRFIAHVGESILTSAGLSDWVAADRDDYVAKAAAFAADLPALSAIRRRLRAQLVASPFCDAPRFARNLETAWRGMWRLWCEGRSAKVPSPLKQ